VPSYSDLINYLSRLDSMPVQVSHVVRWFKENGFQDEINFYPVDVPYKTASAWIVRRKEIGVPYNEASRVTNIYYSKHHNECWQRLFVCKELMHFFDQENNDAADDTQKINVLIRELIDIRDCKELALANTTIADIMAMNRALLCLAPAHIIDDLKEKDVLSKKTMYEIALFFKIPEIMVENIFKEKYSLAHTSVKHDVDLSIVR